MNTHVNIEIAEILFKKHGVLLSHISDVVMWLYEKHGVWVSVHAPHKLLKSWYLEVYRINDEVTLIEESLFKSPTEAYEAAITYVLNNLI